MHLSIKQGGASLRKNDFRSGQKESIAQLVGERHQRTDERETIFAIDLERQMTLPGVHEPGESLEGQGGEDLVASKEVARKRLANGLCDLDGVRRVAVYADRLGDDRYVLAADRTRQSFIHRPLYFRRDYGGGDRAVLLGDDLAAIIVIVEISVKFA